MVCFSAVATQAVLESDARLEAQCLKASRDLLPELMLQSGLPYRQPGSIVLAWDTSQVAAAAAGPGQPWVCRPGMGRRGEVEQNS